jgi:hypothetical protein
MIDIHGILSFPYYDCVFDFVLSSTQNQYFVNFYKTQQIVLFVKIDKVQYIDAQTSLPVKICISQG